MQYRKLGPTGGSSDDSSRSSTSTAKDYVESLHQNNKVTLLYGKNNVFVLPVKPLTFITMQ